MQNITIVGLDLAKNVFQVHGSDSEGQAILRKKMRCGQVLKFFTTLSPCLVGLEACGSAHYWAREIGALGHKVKLIPPQYVRPFVKTNKNDAADAEAIAEALVRPTMRFTPIKSTEQQSVLMLHRIREILVETTNNAHQRSKRAVPERQSPWVGELLVRRPTNVVLVAMANKTTRVVWAMMRDQQDFRPMNA